ncbi:MAG TPA: 50S ribosomal protein L25 [Porticoccaceae bacterium]|nr:50S ribosomal protein L25 [Porticoccaceae bacterium]HCO60987.1 50S ribosomal protein L25 [Porticoccaceae bacterium]
MVDFILNAKSRSEAGKGASRRLRRLAGEVPAIVYGGEKEPEKISLAHNELSHALDNEAFYSHILTLNVGNDRQEVILKDVQRHPAKAVILHVDFLRVSKTQKLTTKVPLHFVNEESCVGVKMEGGLISHSMTELEIQCLPADLPEYLEVDMAEVTVGQILHISDLQLPSGVESVALSHGEDHDLPVATVNKKKGSDELEEEELSAEAPAGEAGKEEGGGDEE